MPSEPRRRRAKRFLIFGLLLLGQLGWAVEPHTDHAFSPSLREELGGARVQPSACHPWEAAHYETSGLERHLHPCAACLHLLRSMAMARPLVPRLAPPALAPTHAASQRSVPTVGGGLCAGPRAPPNFA